MAQSFTRMTIEDVLNLPVLENARWVGEKSSTSVELEDIFLDSRHVQAEAVRHSAGAMFAALPGEKVHGARFAIDTAAAVILTDEEGEKILAAAEVTQPRIIVDSVRDVLGEVAAAIYGYPSRELTLLGVTGTSGKTTTTYILETGLLEAGFKVGIIGTTGTRINRREVPTPLTTPEAPLLQRIFRQMVDEGVSHVVMEVSSHALELGRVSGSEFDVAGFTNLSQDHLDFHATMDEYFAAKAKFFDPQSPVAAKSAVVMVDDEWGRRIASLAESPWTVSTSKDNSADIHAQLLSHEAGGEQKVLLTASANNAPEEGIEFLLPLPGAFNIANAALAIAMVQRVGIDPHTFVNGIEKVGVPGRMERVDAGQGFIAVVDYAHKPAALTAVLDTLREQLDASEETKNARIGVVVGCGGDRDATKRPIMGANAVAAADFVVVTDDNPRSEEPASIRAQVMDGARAALADKPDTDTVVEEIADRAEAIDAVVRWAQPGDAIAVVGKGHETGQIVGDVVHDFDDRLELKRALEQKLHA